MSSFLLTAMPFTGHVAPIATVAEALVARGHDVRVYTGAAFRQRIAATGASFVPWQRAPDFDEQNLSATFPRLRGKRGFAQLMTNMVDLFIATAPLQAADVRAEWERRPWDVLVAEETSCAPALIARQLECRWATLGISTLNIQSRQGPPSGMGLQPGRTPLTRARDAALRLAIPLLAHRLDGPVARAARQTGVPAPRERFDRLVYSRQLILASGVPSLDHHRTDRPAQLRWVGRLASPAAPGGALPDWWGDLAGRTVVHITQGTQNVDPSDLLQPALEALAGTDALLVVTTGIAGCDRLPFRAPANARVADFVPYARLLPATDVMVTNGGWGGVLAALAHGIPLVVAGGDLDKPEIAARVASCGAGIDLRTGTPTARRVREAVGRVSSQACYRLAAQRVAGELAAAGGTTRATELLEQFARGSEPRVS